MATAGKFNPNIITPGTTDGNTTSNAEPDVENNDIIAQKNDEYKLMDGDEDFESGEEGYDMKNDNSDDEKSDMEISNIKPFGGYKVQPKNNNINGAFRKSEIILEAMNKMERDINLGHFERKENEKLIDDHFNKLFNQLTSKKLQLLASLNNYYDCHNQEASETINELKVEYNRQIEVEKDINYNEIEQELQSIKNEQENENIFKRQLTKLKSKKNVQNNENDKPKIKTHDKLRIFFPTKSLYKLVEQEIRIGSDWWNSLKIDHNEFNFHDSKIWRLKCGGWFNAFASAKVGYTQKKKWNIKILARENCDLSQPADIVIGIVDCLKVDKLFNKNKGKRKKASGFWCKGSNGFGFYGWNGKIFHKQKRGIVYGKAYYVNNIVGVELDMGLKLENENDKKKKSKAKTNSIKNIKNGITVASGATISFYVNNKNIGVAFYDIDITKEYVLAVALNSNNYILQLME